MTHWTYTCLIPWALTIKKKGKNAENSCALVCVSATFRKFSKNKQLLFLKAVDRKVLPKHVCN